LDTRFLLQDSPALRREDWLPDDSPFEDLNELHDEHAKLVRARDESSANLLANKVRLEEEDGARQRAMIDGTEPPRTTPSRGTRGGPARRD
jgi:hypothetical protein